MVVAFPFTDAEELLIAIALFAVRHKKGICLLKAVEIGVLRLRHLLNVTVVIPSKEANSLAKCLPSLALPFR